MSRHTIPIGAHGPDIDVVKVLVEEGCDPIRILAKLAMGSDDNLSFAAAKELAQYVHPKKKAMDLRASVKTAVTYQVVSFSDVAPDAAKQLSEQTKNLMQQKLPRTRAEVRLAAAAAPVISAQVIEAMREDIEALEDEDDTIDVPINGERNAP
jgi:hypothetical protein